MALAPEHLLLSHAALEHLDDQLTLPGYDRAALARSIVHLGVGGFHRAHLATYIDELCRSGHTDWSIVGAGVMPGDQAMSEVLTSQDHLYALIERGPDHTSVRVIGSMVDYIHGGPERDRLVSTIAAAPTQIVSLTITEGGYPVDDVSGGFVDDERSGRDGAFGVLVDGLAVRKANGRGGLTVLSCDNVVGNGDVARTATLGVAAKLDEQLAAWITEHVTFPNSMVDRITPATSPSDHEWLVAEHGVADAWPVVTEPFRQWVIEDRFATGRLPLEELDVIVTDDVAPYELMKLRLLNAGHSCLAYLAALDGIETVDAAMSTDHIARFVGAVLRREARRAVPEVAGIDLDGYITSTLERFANPNIGDQISRLCLDGSAKFPKFLLPTVRHQLASHGDVELSALALAGWCEYLRSETNTLSADPLLDAATRHAGASAHDPRAFLDFHQVFGDDLPANTRFVTAFETAIERLRTSGVASAITVTLGDSVDTLEETAAQNDEQRER